jgi:hypothetical protein
VPRVQFPVRALINYITNIKYNNTLWWFIQVVKGGGLKSLCESFTGSNPVAIILVITILITKKMIFKLFEKYGKYYN